MSNQRTAIPFPMFPIPGLLRPVRWLPLLIAAVGVIGCGAAAPPPADNPTVENQPPPEEAPPDPANVTGRFYTTEGQFLVEKLEIEFYGGRRGKHEIWGFYRDQYETMQRIPFLDLVRVDFQGQLDQSIFDQIVLGREQLGLRIEHAFRLRLTFQDQRQVEFYGFIPKVRGIRDFQQWELNMNSRSRYIEYVELEY